MTIHMSEELEKRYEALFDALVPFSGKCETEEGETLRAVSKIHYRYYNDGDKFYEGYGCETAGPSHAYLVDVSPFRDKVAPILDKMDGTDDTQYEEGLNELADTVVSLIELQLRLDKPLTPNDTDMFESESHYQEEDYD
jgi:hypothetical protein